MEPLERAVKYFCRTGWFGAVAYNVAHNQWTYDGSSDWCDLEESDATDLIVAELWRRVEAIDKYANKVPYNPTDKPRIYHLTVLGVSYDGPCELTLLLDALEEIDNAD